MAPSGFGRFREHSGKDIWPRGLTSADPCVPRSHAGRRRRLFDRIFFSGLCLFAYRSQHNAFGALEPALALLGPPSLTVREGVRGVGLPGPRPSPPAIVGEGFDAPFPENERRPVAGRAGSATGGRVVRAYRQFSNHSRSRLLLAWQEARPVHFVEPVPGRQAGAALRGWTGALDRFCSVEFSVTRQHGGRPDPRRQDAD